MRTSSHQTVLEKGYPNKVKEETRYEERSQGMRCFRKRDPRTKKSNSVNRSEERSISPSDRNKKYYRVFSRRSSHPRNDKRSHHSGPQRTSKKQSVRTNIVIARHLEALNMIAWENQGNLYEDQMHVLLTNKQTREHSRNS